MQGDVVGLFHICSSIGRNTNETGEQDYVPQSSTYRGARLVRSERNAIRRGKAHACKTGEVFCLSFRIRSSSDSCREADSTVGRSGRRL